MTLLLFLHTAFGLQLAMHYHDLTVNGKYSTKNDGLTLT